MKTSDLILLLQEHINEHGDMAVTVADWTSDFRFYPVGDLTVQEAHRSYGGWFRTDATHRLMPKARADMEVRPKSKVLLLKPGAYHDSKEFKS